MPASVASRFYILLFQQRMVGWWEEKINLFIMIPGQTTQSQLSISNVHYSLRHQIISHTTILSKTPIQSFILRKRATAVAAHRT